MDDVLQVEEQISQTRGEIETMEAEQQALEHRVAFATIDLQLTEEYKAQLAGGAALSAGSRLRNAAVSGLRNAGDSLLALVVFVEEVGRQRWSGSRSWEFPRPWYGAAIGEHSGKCNLCVMGRGQHSGN